MSIVGVFVATAGALRGAIVVLHNHPWRPWEHQNEFEMVAYSISVDLGVILGPVYI